MKSADLTRSMAALLWKILSLGIDYRKSIAFIFKDILIRVNWNLFVKTMKNHYRHTILWMQLFKKKEI